jgi:D-xylose 1-dehydrogenase (NADP+, D-xylono-1,5-lactone-forming)
VTSRYDRRHDGDATLTARVRFGVVGTANIGRRVVIPAILAAKNAELVAIGSSSDAGATFVRESGLDVRLHGSYEELLADADVDAVYIPLPNHLHREWSKRAADAGKHVLCEKPAALDAGETADMIEHCVARGVVWMEAFMYRYHPQWAAVRGLLDAGAVGELRTVRSVFTFTVRDPGNIRRRPEYGGGSLHDVGAYCVNVARWMFGRQPVAVTGIAHPSPEGVDEDFLGVLDFGSGQSAQFVSSLSQPYRHHVQLLGTAGTITVPRAFVLRRDDDVSIEHTDADGATRSIAVSGDDEYRLEVEDFARCVTEGSQPEVVSHEDTLWNMRTIDALHAAARDARIVRL